LLLGISFDPQILFEEQLSEEHRWFLAFLRFIEEHLPETALARLVREYHDGMLVRVVNRLDKLEALRKGW